jgi:hypothetical protein
LPVTAAASTVGERNDDLDSSIRPVGIDMVRTHGHLALDHSALSAPRPFPGRTLTNPVTA